MIVSLDDIEGLEETLEILSDKRLMRKVRAGIAAAEAGDTIPVKVIERRLRRQEPTADASKSPPGRRSPTPSAYQENPPPGLWSGSIDPRESAPLGETTA